MAGAWLCLLPKDDLTTLRRGLVKSMRVLSGAVDRSSYRPITAWLFQPGPHRESGRHRGTGGIMSGSPPTAVGVFNTSPDTVEMLRIVLEREGLIVVSAYTYDLRDSKIDIEALVRQHQPKVIIFDVAPPYDANWRLFEHIRGMPVLAGIKFVVTTTNVARVREVAGVTEPLLEIVGKPYDLNQIVEAVKKCLSAS